MFIGLLNLLNYLGLFDNRYFTCLTKNQKKVSEFTTNPRGYEYESPDAYPVLVESGNYCEQRSRRKRR